jgi:hypothetical protein
LEEAVIYIAFAMHVECIIGHTYTATFQQMMMNKKKKKRRNWEDAEKVDKERI